MDADLLGWKHSTLNIQRLTPKEKKEGTPVREAPVATTLLGVRQKIDGYASHPEPARLKQ
jgi:hypothetical protein